MKTLQPAQDKGPKSAPILLHDKDTVVTGGRSRRTRTVNIPLRRRALFPLELESDVTMKIAVARSWTCLRRGRSGYEPDVRPLHYHRSGTAAGNRTLWSQRVMLVPIHWASAAKWWFLPESDRVSPACGAGAFPSGPRNHWVVGGVGLEPTISGISALTPGISRLP